MLRKTTLFLFTAVSMSLCASTYQPNAPKAIPPLDITKLKEDPFEHFQQWYQEAKKAIGEEKASTMVLSTATLKGTPSSRVMYAKTVDQNDIAFYGDLRSGKFQELKNNPKASVTFYWPELQRQVNISGQALPISKQEAQEMFNKMPNLEQITAHVSKQGEKMESHLKLEKTHEALAKKQADTPMIMPQHWGGYRLVPQQIEFWQAGPHGLHYRVRYEKTNGNWEKAALYP